jgi:RNA polymerase sigma-70 factor (ECF subfamily)
MDHSATSATDPFKKLYDANYHRIRQLLARIAGPDEAEDLAQSVFAKAARALPSFRGDAQSSTWLHRIAVNVASDWLRGRSAHEAKVTTQLPETLSGEPIEMVADPALVDNPSSPEEEVVHKQMADCLRIEIGKLGKDYQRVLILGELGGLTDDEVASTMGISRANAKVRLHRARAQLKKAIEVRCDFYRQELDCAPSSTSCCPPTATSAPAGTTSSDGKRRGL